MSCDAVREFLLDAGWDAEGRRKALEYLRHLDHCEACCKATGDFDRLRAMLAPKEIAEPAENWDATHRRLSMAKPGRPPLGWMRIGLATAAAVLVAWGSFQIGHRTAPEPTPALVINKTAPVDRMPATISVSEISHDMRAFREVADFYDRRANWMVLSNYDQNVGLVKDPIPAARNVLILRLNLWRGGKSISNTDLMVLAGQNADLTVPLPSGESLHYRIGTSTDVPARLTVWLELKTAHGGEPLAALATNLRLAPGQKLTAGKLATSAGEYELTIDFAGSELADGKP